ncbi:MAG: hypothetical protein K9N06_04985 [Candidatus Cloacimonetes bacterium]|nr:hypothetical protein [Candidatus Cloacimonadota bacterium]
MKILMIVILLMSSFSIYAVSEAACIFTLINPSATNTALGVVGGGANIWNQNPLDTWDNPAILGYHKGISIGYLHDDWFEKVFDDIYFDSAYLTLGWKGLGLMLPMINNQLNFGTSVDYGKQEMYDEDGYFVGTFDSWEISTGFALGMNLLEFYTSLNDNESISNLQKYSDFSIGYNYNLIESNLSPEGQGETETGYKGNGNSHTDGLGMIVRFSPLNETNFTNYSFIKADLVSSVYYRNLSRTSISYVNEDQKDPLPYSTDTAVSFRIAIGAENVKEMIPSVIFDELSVFCSDIISVYGNYGSSNLMEENDEWGKGIELTLLDIVSFRWGYHQDKDGHIEGKTSGIGLNLRYKDLVRLQYNYAKFPGGDLQKFQRKSDFMLNVNLMTLLGIEQ